MLETLEQLEILTLPPKRHRGRGPQRPVGTAARSDPQPPVAEPLAALRPLRLELAENPETVAEWNEWVQRHHYLGYRQPFGAHLRYFLRDCQGRLLGCLLFDFAARDLACRDRRIGWQGQAHRKHLRLVVRNSRFLLLPWVQVKNLGLACAGAGAAAAARGLAAEAWLPAGFGRIVCGPGAAPGGPATRRRIGSGWGRRAAARRRATSRPNRRRTCTSTRCGRTGSGCWPGARRACPGRVRRSRSHGRNRDERFTALWQEILAAVVQVANEHDAAWMQRQRVLNTLLVVLFVFRLVFAPKRQGYALTLRDLWAQCRALDIPLPKPEPVSQAAMHAARRKVHDEVFFRIHREILRHAPPDEPRTLWYGHRTFAVDGSKLNLPQPLLENGYRLPSDGAHYPQGPAQLPVPSALPPAGRLRTRPPRRRAPPGPGPLARPRPLRCRRLRPRLLLLPPAAHPPRPRPARRLPPQVQRQLGLRAVPPLRPPRRHRPPSRPPTRPASNSPRPAGGPAAAGWSATPPATPTTCWPPPCSTAAATPSAPSRTSTMRGGAWKNCTRSANNTCKSSASTARASAWSARSSAPHFSLIAMTRLFTNQSEAGFRSEAGKQPQQANFRNGLRTVGRHLEGLLLTYATTLSETVSTILASIAGCRQRKRPNRSYPRVSHKPVNKWRSRKSAPARSQPDASKIPCFSAGNPHSPLTERHYSLNECHYPAGGEPAATKAPLRPAELVPDQVAEILSPDCPGERLLACLNPRLRAERARKREDLLQATEALLEKIAAPVRRGRKPLRGRDAINRRVGREANRKKVEKHFEIVVDRRGTALVAQAGADRGRGAAGRHLCGAHEPGAGRARGRTPRWRRTRAWARVERAFRSLKTTQLHLRPVYVYSAEHVRGHVFLCMLAYYVEWHLRRKLAPLLFEDAEREAAAAGVTGRTGDGFPRCRGQGGHEADPGRAARAEPADPARPSRIADAQSGDAPPGRPA